MVPEVENSEIIEILRAAQPPDQVVPIMNHRMVDREADERREEEHDQAVPGFQNPENENENHPLRRREEPVFMDLGPAQVLPQDGDDDPFVEEFIPLANEHDENNRLLVLLISDGHVREVYLLAEV